MTKRADKPTVVLLHGLGRSHRSMASLGRYIERLGYRTWARTYPSRRGGSLAQLADGIAARIRRDLGDRPLVGVTHSMGGVLVRHMREQLEWRGVVMLAPPNQGSRVAAGLVGKRLVGWYFGAAGRQLADATGWPPPPEPFAIIAGTRGPSIGNVPSWVVRGLKLLPAGAPHDGTVLVAETQIEGMAGFAEVDASHTFLMNHPATRELVRQFLIHRRFRPG